MISARQHKSNSILNFFEKNSKLLGFHAVVLVKTFPLMYINYQCMTDIDEAKVIPALQHKSKFNFELFWKKIKFLGFHAVASS